MRYFVFLSFVIFVPRAQASCGAASCPVDPVGARSMEGGSVELGYEFEYILQDRARIGDRRASVGQISGHHNEAYTESLVHRAKASWDVTDRWGVDLQLPYVYRRHEHIHRHQGQNLIETWNMDGVGDLYLQGRWTFLKPESWPALTALLGVELPTGRHHLTRDGNAEAEAPVQPGSGSVDWQAGLSARRSFGAVPAFASFVWRTNGRSKEEYQIGDSYQASAGAVYPLTSRWSLMGQANYRHNREDDKGQTREEVDKTGGSVLYLSPGLEFKATEALRAFVLVQLPAYQWVNRIQLVSSYNLLMGASLRFRVRS